MNALNGATLATIVLANLLLVQVLWAWYRAPLLSKPKTWSTHWSLKANAGLTPAMVALSYL